ncbi:BLOC-1-related complex subunit 6 [Elysia marginata]|uniref:BLOC-1-related complex subunit 6 n=1 Tax=Elysia marginata TaxID=1093978 RepID=A0AAV4GKS0_9GAST|nr:BLOC-1-related complex subunit 6 [Elysia marginata]
MFVGQSEECPPATVQNAESSSSKESTTVTPLLNETLPEASSMSTVADLLLTSETDISQVAPSDHKGHDSPKTVVGEIQAGGARNSIGVDIQSSVQYPSAMSANSGNGGDFCKDYQSAGIAGTSEVSDATQQSFVNAPRPESLSLQASASASNNEPGDLAPEMGNTDFDSSVFRGTQPIDTPSQRFKKRDQFSSLSHSLPKGTVTRKGDLIEFVASDLQEKIKQSSPLSQPDAASSGSRRSSIKSYASASSSTSFATSSGLSQSPSSACQQSPDDIPPIDAAAVIELELHATRVADSLDLMMGNIRNNLHKMSAITIGCQEAYKRSVDITCDSVDASIKTMYALMAKCEELSASMGPVRQLALQIKDIKRVLDLFESQLTDK